MCWKTLRDRANMRCLFGTSYLLTARNTFSMTLMRQHTKTEFTVFHFQAQNYKRIYLDYIHMDHIYTQCKGLKLYNGYSYWYLTYDMHQ
jgi:hypothetical protein